MNFLEQARGCRDGLPPSLSLGGCTPRSVSRERWIQAGRGTTSSGHQAVPKDYGGLYMGGGGGPEAWAGAVGGI